MKKSFVQFWQTLLWQWLAVTLGKAATPSTVHPKIVYWDTKCCSFCLFDFLLIHFGFDLWLPLHLNKDPETAELVKSSSVHFCQRSVSISSLLRLLCTSKNASVNETSKTPFRSWLREGGRLSWFQIKGSKNFLLEAILALYWLSDTFLKCEDFTEFLALSGVCNPVLDAQCVRFSSYSAVFRCLCTFGMMPQDMLPF